MRADCIRHHLWSQIKVAKSTNSKELVLNYEHNKVVNVIDDALNLYDGRDNPKYMVELGIAKIVQI